MVVSWVVVVVLFAVSLSCDCGVCDIEPKNMVSFTSTINAMASFTLTRHRVVVMPTGISPCVIVYFLSLLLCVVSDQSGVYLLTLFLHVPCVDCVQSTVSVSSLPLTAVFLMFV